MLNRRSYGLQLQAIQNGTHVMDWYTPRTLDIALAMAETHSDSHSGDWVYKILFFGNGAWEPIIFDTEMLATGEAGAMVAAAARETRKKAAAAQAAAALQPPKRP